MPANDNEFYPDGFRCSHSVDGTDIKLSFYNDNDKSVDVVIPRVNLPPLLTELNAQIGQGTVRPINAGELEMGSTFRLAGRQVGLLPDGSVRLTLHVEVEGGARSLPINLSPTEAAQLAAELKPS